MNKDDFVVWRMNPVTDGFKDAVLKELDSLVADLVNNAGNDPGNDKFVRGQIVGLQWLIDWVPEFIEDDDDEGDNDDGVDSEGAPGPY